MEIDNYRNATIAKRLLISTPFVLLLGTGLMAIFQIIFTWIPTIISGILMILGWTTTIILRLKSVKFKMSNHTIAFLYYPISPITSDFKRIEIASNKLIRFEVRTSLLGFRKELVLFESINGEQAAYPPVSINLFGKVDLRDLLAILQKLCS